MARPKGRALPILESGGADSRPAFVSDWTAALKEVDDPGGQGRRRYDARARNDD